MRPLVVLALCLMASPHALGQNVTFIESTGFGITMEEALATMGVWQHTWVWPTAMLSLDQINAAFVSQSASGDINSTAAMINGIGIYPMNYVPPPGVPEWYIVVAGVVPFAGHMAGYFVLATGPDSILLVKPFIGVAYKQDGLLQFQATSKDNTMVARAALAEAPDGAEVFHTTLSKLSAENPTGPTDFANMTFIQSLGYTKMDDWTVDEAMASILKLMT